ncbi:MAG: hypothetical protein DRI57_24035 [Deltaproteobacteria bacterium]|nr:MAG: hypothetical protein DRI57_24035 [Deltaproteobacteria bacterium]
MSSDHFYRLAEDFGKKKVALFLGPLFIITNIYPAIRNFFRKGQKPHFMNNAENAMLKKDELQKIAKICAMLWKQQLNFQHLSDDRQSYAMSPVHCLSSGWPVRFILTPQFDLHLNELFYISAYSSALSRVWQNDLKNFLNGSGHIFHAFGGSNSENLLEVTDMIENIEEKEVFRDYFTALFQKFSPLFIGFDPNDPVFRKLQEICAAEVSDAPPWYVFFTSRFREKLNSGIDFRVISAYSDTPDANEMQDINTGFFIRLLESGLKSEG